MKKKILILLIAIIVIGGAAILSYKAYFNTNDNIQPIYLVPKDAVYIFETETPISNWNTLSNSAIWKHLNTNTYFNSLAENLNKLDTLFKEKKGLFDKIGERDVLISAHVYAPKKYSFLYIVDLQKIAKLNIIKNNINALVSGGFKVSKRNYNSQEITEIYNKNTRETIYISFIKNQMIVSFVHRILEASIDEYLNPTIGRNLNFIEVKKSIGYNDLCRLYLQHSQIDDFLKVYSNTSPSIVNSLSTNFDFSGFSFDLDEDLVTANGFTTPSNTASYFVKALQKSGKNKRTLANIAPQNTATFTNFSFEDFETFYTNFETLQKENASDFKAYLDAKEKVENFLDISLKTHFVSWISDEIGVIQMHSAIHNTKNDVAVVLKSKSATLAKKQLDFISTQIRKKSPVKFKTVNYKGYDINYLDIKGFFKAFIGNLFNSIDKPYYTIIDDYVVFSNKPNTLKSIINNYTAQTTLAHSEDFKTFNKQFNSSSTIFTYINTPQLYSTLFEFLDANSKAQLKANKDYMICFESFGFELTPEDQFFESKLVVKYTPISDLKPLEIKVEQNTTETIKDSISETISDSNNTIAAHSIFEIPEIYPTDLTANSYTKLRTDGTIDFDVELKDGLPHGRYKSYHANGAVKITGKYSNGKQTGSWKAYDTEKNRIAKKRF